MPHFSKSNHQFKFGLSGDKNYRLTAWINFQTPWNDAANRYDPMTEEQRTKCEELFRQFQTDDFQISVTITERTDAVTSEGKPDWKAMPVAGRMTLYPNDYTSSSHIRESISVDTSAPAASTQSDDGYKGFA